MHLHVLLTCNKNTRSEDFYFVNTLYVYPNTHSLKFTANVHSVCTFHKRKKCTYKKYVCKDKKMNKKIIERLGKVYFEHLICVPRISNTVFLSWRSRFLDLYHKLSIIISKTPTFWKIKCDLYNPKLSWRDWICNKYILFTHDLKIQNQCSILYFGKE